MKVIDAILLLLHHKFLDIFWFYFWIFIAGELVIYSIEKIFKMPQTTQWYDLLWLIIIFVCVFLTSYRLYILTIEALLESK
ncbi:MAG: hypothetical protein EOM50_23475 [Erysipelotrichia bacterium]|nr:hypothetical protein [Erysipelotrichia bacterium]